MYFDLNKTYGGMPAKHREIKPMITFKDLEVGLRAKAVKNTTSVKKGEIVTVIKKEQDKVHFKGVAGEQSLSSIEFFLYFTHPDG